MRPTLMLLALAAALVLTPRLPADDKKAAADKDTDAAKKMQAELKDLREAVRALKEEVRKLEAARPERGFPGMDPERFKEMREQFEKMREQFRREGKPFFPGRDFAPGFGPPAAERPGRPAAPDTDKKLDQILKVLEDIRTELRRMK